jgi:hypothetical protein
MALHERSEKNSHLDTILYEIDMLRHCLVTAGLKRSDSNTSDYAGAEYNLAIEGFLLHLRNLLAFFTNRKKEGTDLIVNEPLVWAGKDIAQRDYSGLIKAFKGLDRKFGSAGDGRGGTCYQEISIFLQHCTTYRYERAKRWPIEDIYNDLNPLLEDFETCFAKSAGTVNTVKNLPDDGVYGTQSVRTFDSLFEDSE